MSTPIVHCRVAITPHGDRISVYVGRSVDTLRLAGVVWVNRENGNELVRRLQSPEYLPEVRRMMSPDDERGDTVPFPRIADHCPLPCPTNLVHLAETQAVKRTDTDPNLKVVEVNGNESAQPAPASDGA